MRATVVNRRDAPYDIFIGRPSPLGNPFRIGQDGSREDVIRKYEAYARDRVERSPVFRRQILECHGKRLGCYCAPLPCHGDVIAVLAEELTDAPNPRH